MWCELKPQSGKTLALYPAQKCPCVFPLKCVAFSTSRSCVIVGKMTPSIGIETDESKCV